jgi:hypothetical protein
MELLVLAAEAAEAALDRLVQQTAATAALAL